MPNWCHNKLKIRSNLRLKESLIEFAKWMGENQPLSFEKLLPTPVIKSRSKWREEHWGIKYDVHRHECFRTQSSENIEISFITAWKPPLQGLIFLSDKFPELIFELTFSEPKKSLAGFATIRRGELENITSYGGMGLTGLMQLK